MLETIKTATDWLQWAFGLVTRWLPTRRKPTESWTHSVEAVEWSRDHIRFFRETRKKEKS
jgi:hypothetical protein